MHNSKLESNGSQKYLICYYHPNRRNFTEIIQDAFQRHKIADTEAVKIPVLCLPITDGVDISGQWSNPVDVG